MKDYVGPAIIMKMLKGRPKELAEKIKIITKLRQDLFTANYA